MFTRGRGSGGGPEYAAGRARVADGLRPPGSLLVSLQAVGRRRFRHRREAATETIVSLLAFATESFFVSEVNLSLAPDPTLEGLLRFLVSRGDRIVSRFLLFAIAHLVLMFRNR